MAEEVTARDASITLENGQGVNDTWCTCDALIELLNDPRIGGVALDPCGHPSNIFARQTAIWLPPEPTEDALRRIFEKKDRKGVAGGQRAVDAYLATWRADCMTRIALFGQPGIIGPVDGLTLSWTEQAQGGLTYFNEPFSDIEPWVAKAANEDGEMLGLFPARMNAAYFDEHVWPTATSVFVPRRRITFKGATTQPPFHCVLLYWGARLEVFRDVLNTFATCLVPSV